MKILITWELGKNFGHIAKLIEIARPLAEKGADIYFALQNPGSFLTLKPDFPHTILQAPFSPIKPLKEPILTYCDDLRPCGYDNASTLAGLIEAWRSLYNMVKPDIVIAESSPTALLAARDYPFAKVAIGTSYEIPPMKRPMPLMPYWENVNTDVLMKREQGVVDVINGALESLSLDPIEKFSDIFDIDTRFLCSFEELDHYPEREKAQYYGALFKTDSGASLKWNQKAKKHIFAYLRPEVSSFRPAFEALCNLPDDYDVIIAAPGIDPKVKSMRESESIGIEDGMVKLDHIFSKCDLAVCHAGVGMSSAFLLHGVPLLMLPGHIEQLMFARAVGRYGAGRGVVGRFGPEKVHELIDLLLTEPEFKKTAQKFAKDHKSYKTDKVLNEIIDEITALAKPKRKRKRA